MTESAVPKEFKKDKIVARVVWIAPSTTLGPTDEAHAEIPLSLRPRRSKQGGGEWALLGGKLESEDFQKAGILETAILTAEEVRLVTIFTIVREIFEETGYELAPSLLQFITIETNREGWSSAVFAVETAEKPALKVPDESEGLAWFSSREILKASYSNPIRKLLRQAFKGIQSLTGIELGHLMKDTFFADHPALAATVLQVLAENSPVKYP
jgi:8-oxo-dGTP pyrophosphatase MutT (NUDIX family)